MSDPIVQKIQNHPKYKELRAKRNPLVVTLTIIMLIVYYGYVGLIAFDKELLAMPIGSGVTSMGIPLGMGVIIFTIAITVYYVQVANNKFDAMTEELLKDVTK